MGIRVASLNVWALPAGLARHEGERMRAIAGTLPKLAPDLLAFQEVWTETSRDKLVAGARAAGLQSIWHPQDMSDSGGLLIASRFPLADVRFDAYRARGFPERIQHSDYWGGKGFIRARVDTPYGVLDFANTHLHANYAPPGTPDEYVGVRTAQLVQFAAGLRDARAPLLAVGDFNLVESEDGYDVLRGLSGLQDVATALDRREATARAGNPYRRKARDDSRIDYVFERPGEERRLVAKSIERVFDTPLQFGGEPGNYSDHAGLLATFEFEAHRATRPPPDRALIERARDLLAEGRALALRRRSNQRQTAAAAGCAVLIGAAATRMPRVTRRRLLRNALVLGCATSGGLGAGHLWLSEWIHPDEVSSFDAALADLEDYLAPLRRHTRTSPIQSTEEPLS
ncbi:MAG: endonuclease/exonuclease/phosphatase family protein [Myxococcota bacterium]|jgi:endonuclease/exonuclease/phosphatase family metal-dependent hydrolase|nr:endonuclease/exonuclease/phosphatase family protein [Myxococcota bacterium]